LPSPPPHLNPTLPASMWSKIDQLKLGLRPKLIFFGLGPALLVLLAISLFSLLELRSFLVHLQTDEIVDELHSAAHQIEQEAIRAKAVVRTMAFAQENGLFGRRAESSALARTILERSPFLTGAYFGYEPNADGQDASALRSSLDPKTMDAQGRFLPYWHRDLQHPDTLVVAPLVDMETSLYYGGNRNRFLGLPESQDILFARTSEDEPIPLSNAVSRAAAALPTPPPGKAQLMVTEPYVYEGNYLLELTYPIVINGQFKGIAGVDWALKDLVRFLNDQKPFQTADFILISQRGRIISSTHDPEQLLAQRIEDTPFESILEPLYTNRSLHNQPLDHFTHATLGLPFYYAATPIPSLGWTLVIRVSRAEINAPVRSTLTKAGLLTLLGVIAVFLLLISLANLVIRRIQTAAATARQIASGDLTAQVDSSVQDETGDLLRAIKGMVHDLRSLVGKVKTSSIQLVSTATQIGAAAKQQEAVVNDFGASTAQIAAAVKEISATSNELLRTMEDVSTVAQETASMVDDGRSGLTSMSSAIEHLANSTTTITSALSVINEKANNIGSVITTITKVADQTNLLSLNAAIEAEKAGEYGVGFAVVAREIRRLADQTAVATLDIEQMVKEMQSSVSTGVMQMDKFNEEVRRRIHETESIASGLTQIIERVHALIPRFDQVHEGMQSQSQGARQISDAMLQLTESARSSAAALREFNQAADQLHGAVRGLKDEVSRFTM
ncbi:MAG: methyl-accepting chemotaxis protein, partial [Verrucomicrobiia bacterium]